MADRLSFRRFCGFGLDEATPDATMISRLRCELAKAGLAEKVFQEIGRQLDKKGLVLKQGTLIDATLVEADARRPPMDEGEVSGRDPLPGRAPVRVDEALLRLPPGALSRPRTQWQPSLPDVHRHQPAQGHQSDDLSGGVRPKRARSNGSGAKWRTKCGQNAQIARQGTKISRSYPFHFGLLRSSDIPPLLCGPSHDKT